MSSIRMKKSRYAKAFDDCEELLNRFETRNSVNFDTFAEIWQEMTFSLIFCGRRSEEDLVEFCEEVLMAAKSCWLPSNSTERRLLATYLLYGVYFKQPCRNVAKIKLVKSEWDEVVNFVNYIRNFNMKEQLFMFVKLFEHNAFQFCAVACELHPEKRTQKRDALDMKMMLSGSHVAAPTSINLARLTKTGVIDQVIESLGQYELSKKNAEERQLIPKHSELTTVSQSTSNLGLELRNICLRHTLDRSAERSSKPSKSKAKTPALSVGHRRRALKARCMGAIVARGNVKRNEISTNNNEELEVPETEKIRQRKRKERGYYLTTRFKQHRELVDAPNEGKYDQIHSMNSRTLYQKVLPKIRNKLKEKTSQNLQHSTHGDKSLTSPNKPKFVAKTHNKSPDVVLSQYERDIMEAGPSTSYTGYGSSYRNWTEDDYTTEDDFPPYRAKATATGRIKTEDVSQSELSMPELD